MKRIHLLATLPLLVFLASCSTDPKVQSNQYVTNGNKYYDRGRYKEASIMYRRALQKNMKNADAWYKLGLINLGEAAYGEGRGDLIRVADLAEADHKFDAKVKDAITRVADIDYAGYARYPEKLKDYQSDLKRRAQLLQQHFPNTFDTYRVAGLAAYSDGVGVKKREERQPIVQDALADFKKADALKPYDTALGFALVSTLAESGQVPEAEKYANEMIARKTADDRVYSSLYWYYLQNGRVPDAEAIRKKEVENMPKAGTAYIELASHYFLTKNKPEMLATLNRLTSDLKTFPNAYMMVGDFYYSLGNLGAAIPAYQEGVKVDAANKIVYLKKTAEAETLLARYGDASKLVAELLKIDPNDAEAIAMDASLQLNHAKREDADKVIARLQPLLAKTPPNEPERGMILHFNLGRAYALKGDPQSMDQARLQLEEALKSRPPEKVPYIPALMALGQLELQRGGNPAAFNYASKIIQYDPSNLTAHLMRTMAMTNLGEIDKARQDLSAILKSKPDSADAHFQLARIDFIQKRYKEAESEFELLKNGKDPRGVTGLIECKVAEGSPADAVQLLETELKRDPNSVMFRNGLATLYYNVGKPNEAASEYQKLIGQNPAADAGSRELWYLRLGESLRQAKNNAGARDAFEKAGQIAPKHATPKLEMAMLLQTEGKEPEARKAYEQVLQVEPDNPVALNNIAYAKADDGTDLDGALAFAQKARRKAPDDPNVMDTLGLIYFKKDLLDDSLRVFSDLAARAPSNPTYRLHLAMALYKKGDRARAKRELEAASHNSPNGREQAQIQELRSKIG